MQNQNSANPTDIVDLCLSERGVLPAWELAGSKPVEEECQNQLNQLAFCPFFDKNQQNTGIFEF